MGKFLRENWLWIVAPIVFVLILFIVIIVVNGQNDASPFVYNIF